MILLLLFATLAAAQEKAGQVTRSVAPAYVVRDVGRPWLPGAPRPVEVEALAETEFRSNDSLKTGKGGRLQAKLNGGSVLTLGPDAGLLFWRLDESAQQYDLWLRAGMLRVELAPLSQPDARFLIWTNLGTVRVLGGDITVSATDPVSTVVIAVSGTAEVSNSEGNVRLTDNQVTRVGFRGPPSPPEAASAAMIAGAAGKSAHRLVFQIGDLVSAPRLIHHVEPSYTEAARKAKLDGTVVLYAVVDEQGMIRDIRVVRGPGMGLEEAALEAVRQWRFEPGRKEGKPVAVATTIEVTFHAL